MKSGDCEVLLVGYGNELRGDDGLGPFVARAVETLHCDGVIVKILPVLVPELAEAVSAAGAVIFVDARVDRPEEPVEVLPLRPTALPSTSGHRCEPASVLAMAGALYGRCPPAWWITVAGVCFELGERLSKEAHANAAAAVTKINDLMEAIASRP